MAGITKYQKAKCFLRIFLLFRLQNAFVLSSLTKTRLKLKKDLMIT